METGRELYQLQTEEPNKRITNPFASLDQFSPDGRWLAATRSVPELRECEAFLWKLSEVATTPASLPGR